MLGLLTSLPVAPFSAAVTAAAAVTAEATSGRARRADGKHRRKAQTQSTDASSRPGRARQLHQRVEHGEPQ